LSFMQENLDNCEQFRSFWQWRHENKEVSGGETAVIAKEKGKVVGCVGIVPAMITMKGLRIKASWQQDSLVSPAMRGKGLGKRLVKEGAEGWDLVMAKGTNKPMYGLRKSLSFIDVPKSNYLIRVCNVRDEAKSVKEHLVEYVLRLWKSFLSIPKKDDEIEVKPINSFDKSYNNLADELVKENVLRQHKGQDYLNWRYFGCPEKIYIVFRAGEAKARGAVICKISGANSDEGWIVDLICPSFDYQCAYALLNAAVNYFEDQGVSRCWVFATLPAARKWLYRFGYLPTKRTPRFTYRVQQKYLNEKFIDSTKWDFWHGDGDLELYM
jgi:GNAT superfamily N-acetyltransferase